MKRITKLGNNRYIHMDLDTSRKHPFYVAFLNGVMTTFVLAIAAITAGAMVGIDITNIKPTPTQQVK
jgi:ABC-type amino acid transport system permease subunit